MVVGLVLRLGVCAMVVVGVEDWGTLMVVDEAAGLDRRVRLLRAIRRRQTEDKMSRVQSSSEES